MTAIIIILVVIALFLLVGARPATARPRLPQHDIPPDPIIDPGLDPMIEPWSDKPPGRD